jgi:hypothetical protein
MRGAATVELQSLVPALATKRAQSTGLQGFFLLSTPNVDNSVHVLLDGLRKKAESRMNDGMVKKVPPTNTSAKSTRCAWNREGGGCLAGVTAASTTVALLLCTTVHAGSLALPCGAPARRMSSGRRWL